VLSRDVFPVQMVELRGLEPLGEVLANRLYLQKRAGERY
jgi:hypothetical protein